MTVTDYLSYFEEMMRPTIPMFKLVPPDKIDWKPFDKTFTAGQLMAHMAVSLEFYGKGLARGDWGLSSLREIFLRNRHTPSLGVDESVRLMQENYAKFRKAVEGLSEDEFNTGVIDSPQLGRVPRWRLGMLAVEHLVNHRAELFMYLRMLGVDVNTGTLYAGKTK